MRDAVTAKDYELQCSKLIGQYKTLWESLRGQARPAAVAGHQGSPLLHRWVWPCREKSRLSQPCNQVGDLQDFTREYNLQCPMAIQRLVASGMPATVEHGKPTCGPPSPRALPAPVPGSVRELTAGPPAALGRRETTHAWPRRPCSTSSQPWTPSR